MMSIARQISPTAPVTQTRTLRQVVAGEALAAAPDGVDLLPYRDYFDRTYGSGLVAVILYGSLLSPVLRSTTSTPDFVVITDDGRIPAHSRATRALHDVLAPTSRSANITGADGVAVFKYLHLDQAQLARTTGPGLRDLFVAGRLCKQVRLIYARDPAARDAVIDALLSSVRQLAPLVCALLPASFDLERYVLDSLAISYRGEWRIEVSDKVERLARAGWPYYLELYGAVLDEQLTQHRVAVQGDHFVTTTTTDERRAALRMLRRTRRRAALRWPKYAITVPHAGQLVAGKLARARPGLRIPAFAQRHPVLCALPMLLWLLVHGALRSRPGTSPRIDPVPPVPRPRSPPRLGLVASPARLPSRPKVALIANLAARGPRTRGFDAAAYGRLLGAGSTIHCVESWDALRGAVAETCRLGVDAIAVMGGDGTLGGVVSELMALAPAKVPAIVPLCGGGYNLAARILGATRSPWRDVKRLAAHLERGLPLQERGVRMLRIEDPDDERRVRHGFVFGTGVVYEYGRHIASHGGTGWWNSIRRSVSLTMGGLFGTTAADAVWRQFPAAVCLDDEELPQAAFTAVCACAVVGASSLVKLLPEARPPASGTFVYLASALPRGELLHRRIVSVLRGTCRSSAHLTGHAASLRLASGCGYLLDGELVAARAGSRELTIAAGPTVRFWLPMSQPTRSIAPAKGGERPCR